MAKKDNKWFSDPIAIALIRDKSGKIIYGNEEIAKRMDNMRKAQKALGEGDTETYEKFKRG